MIRKAERLWAVFRLFLYRIVNSHATSYLIFLFAVTLSSPLFNSSCLIKSPLSYVLFSNGFPLPSIPFSNVPLPSGTLIVKLESLEFAGTSSFLLFIFRIPPKSGYLSQGIFQLILRITECIVFILTVRCPYFCCIPYTYCF